MHVDDSIRKVQSEKLSSLRSRRNNEAVKASLMKIQEATRNSRNIMPHVIEAVEQYATLGEIADSLREIYGEYQG